MKTLPKVSTYSLATIGRQSSSLEIRMRSPLSLAYFYKDGAYTRFDRSVLPNTRDVLGKHGGTYFII